MPGRDIIVIGASAGGVEALTQLVAGLPPDLPAAMFIVCHFPASGKSILPSILDRACPLHAAHAQDGEVIEHRRIYVALPGYHLLVKRGYVRLVQGPQENGTRPAIDPLFRTAAKAYKRRVVSVVLSGTLDDGTAGLIDVKKLGGVAVAQHPDDALFSGMPKSAIEHVEVDHILPASAIASVLVSLAHELAVEEGSLAMSNSPETEMEPDIVELDGQALRNTGQLGTPSTLPCPDCGGVLQQLHQRDLLQFRCCVGHAWSAQNLVLSQAKAQKEALWAAIRSLEEQAELMNKMAEGARQRNSIKSAKRFEAQAQEAEQRADLLRQALFQGQLSGLNTNVALDQVSNEGQALSAVSKVVVLMAEVGSLLALSHILSALPLHFPAAIIVVQRLEAQSELSLITDAMSRPTTLPFKQAQAGEPLQPGTVYIAPPASHLFVTPNKTFSLSQAVFVGLERPSTDLLLQSVAASFKKRAIAVVLTGKGSDGARGVEAVQRMGGKVIIQDEKTADFFDMPSAAIATEGDFILPLNEIASCVVNLVMTSDEHE